MEKIHSGHPRSQSTDFTKAHIETLKQLFPTIVKEGQIDFEELKALLSDELVAQDEYYRFTWAGKQQARQEAKKPTAATLRPDREASVDWETTGNLFLEGDNLEVLKVLQKSYANRVKMIYIDPPYNTGKDFVYKDNYADNLRNYLALTGQVDEAGNRLSTNTESDGRFHSNWLNMMYPRLVLARNLLTEDGVIFISIDDNEVANLRKLCDEVFGEENYVGQWNWFKSATPPNLSKKIKKNIEYILCFQRGENRDVFRGIQKISASTDPITKPQNTVKRLVFPVGSLIAKKDGVYPPGTYGTDKYPNVLCTELVIRNHTNVSEVIFENKFIWVQDKLDQELSNQTKMYLSDKLVLSYKKEEYGEEVPPNFIDKSVYVETTEHAGNDLTVLMQEEKLFDYPKPISLIKYLINFLSDPDITVLDFFAGSGTTAHAVMALNAEDGGKRKFICVQLPEPTDEKSEAYKAGYTTIAEITKERIRRAGRQIKEGQGSAAPDLFASQQKPLPDVGFRAYKLDTSNIKAWDSTPEQLEQSLFAAVENLKPERSEEDILTEVLLKYGLGLTQPIATRRIGGANVYAVAEGALLVCLSTQITEEVVAGMAAWKEELSPLVCSVLLRDSALSDQAKVNAAKTLQAAGIEEVHTL